jgi:hypothetical protein
MIKKFFKNLFWVTSAASATAIIGSLVDLFIYAMGRFGGDIGAVASIFILLILLITAVITVSE